MHPDRPISAISKFPAPQGRGAAENPTNRFVKLNVVTDPDQLDEDLRNVEPGQECNSSLTQFFHDSSRQIITTNDSPDIGFDASINPYRGCEHGCIYCFARPTHEYLGFSAGLDFETKIMVKLDAPQLLRAELDKPSWKPRQVQVSGVTDCYQPIERKLTLTRQCLQVLADFGNPVTIVTKNHLVTRDIDILSRLAKIDGIAVLVSITTLDAELARKMEPRTSVPRRRLEAIAELNKAGIPAGVMCAPMIPGLNDHEMPAILQHAADAGAKFASFTPIRLPHAVKDLFSDWLARHYPDRQEKVLGRIRDLRGGKLNDANFGSRMEGQGIWADQLSAVFEMSKKKAGINGRFPKLSTSHFQRPRDKSQMMLF